MLMNQNPISRSITLATVLIFGVLNTASHAGTFNKEYELESLALPIRGTASYQYLFWKLYEAALYMPREVAGEDVLKDDTPRALKIVYEREITAEQLVKSGTKILEKNFSARQLAAIQEGLDEINRAYQNVNEGDSYELIYSPDTGTSLILNGDSLCTIPGKDFAKIYFSIWLGPNSKSKQLNDALCALD